MDACCAPQARASLFAFAQTTTATSMPDWMKESNATPQDWLRFEAMQEAARVSNEFMMSVDVGVMFHPGVGSDVSFLPKCM